MRNANRLFRNGEGNGKVIQNALHLKLTTFRGPTLAHAYRVWSTSVTVFVSYPGHRQIG